MSRHRLWLAALAVALVLAATFSPRLGAARGADHASQAARHAPHSAAQSAPHSARPASHAVRRTRARATPRRARRQPAVPFGFVGMNLDGPLFDGGSYLPRVYRQMVASGIDSVRVVFSWAEAQPQRDSPIDFTRTDAMVGDAARDGLTVLPIVIYTPYWDAEPHKKGTYAAPVDDAPYAAYLTALIGRYGPSGTYWAQHPGVPKVPIRMWQIWNEPNLRYYWATTNWVPGYVSLLAAASAAVRAADPGAKVVLAGFPDTAWQYLSEIYHHGARNDFDVVAAHPYTAKPANVIRFMRLMRGTMRRNGDASKPLLITETGWSSSYPGMASDNFCCQTTERGQAAAITALLPLLAQNRKALNLLAFYYYTWAGQEYIGARSFNFAGLFDINYNRLMPKPAFPAFRKAALALEHCRRKAARATRCAVRG